MSIFGDDKYWNSTYQFIKKNCKKGDLVIAPTPFEQELENTIDYSKINSLDIKNIQWFVIHKGMIEDLDREFIDQAIEKLSPVFANEVFVILSQNDKLNKIAADNIHLTTLSESMEKTPSKSQYDNLVSLVPNFISRQFNNKNNIFFDIKQIVKKHREEVQLSCRQNYQTAYLGNGILLCRVLTKYFCYVQADDIGIAPHLSLNGYWEMWITEAITDAIQPGWHCIDIGANHGYYSLIMADIVGSSGHVIAIEPNPNIEKLLRRTMEVNGFLGNNSEVIQMAVADEIDKTVNLYLPEGRGINGSICAGVSEEELSQNQDNVFPVQTTTLDELTKDWQKVDFVKIDAEGAEESIWKGMQNTITKNPDINIVLEFAPVRCDNPKALIEEIVKAGFILRYIDYDGKLKILTIDECLTKHPSEDWMLFLKRN
ncbi:FkbM family methyltransferase [Cyanobacterium stanieri LEGE 03274]|uniref:FkbM family methyltransferase n=1 Tax=Cyanobacterium stanieri LEGE 03274 TaxID=1828756 RepID=A0ABR9V3U1_9CHRO|nr:FkbM family methyltransferase [Cyanobacterium stanieri]MBE9222219.1 FkbM family methyltransferase [Cyanobacterium stanieri LEGE 03274]